METLYIYITRNNQTKLHGKGGSFLLTIGTKRIAGGAMGMWLENDLAAAKHAIE